MKRKCKIFPDQVERKTHSIEKNKCKCIIIESPMDFIGKYASKYWNEYEAVKEYE